MAHVMKFTKASCGHMFAHFDRKAEHISNENLTGEDTPQLQSRHPSDDGSGRVCTQEVCRSPLPKPKRCECDGYLGCYRSQDLPEQEHKAFFQASYDFLQQRYGRENVVGLCPYGRSNPAYALCFCPCEARLQRGQEKPRYFDRISQSFCQRGIELP